MEQDHAAQRLAVALLKDSRSDLQLPGHAGRHPRGGLMGARHRRCSSTTDRPPCAGPASCATATRRRTTPPRRTTSCFTDRRDRHLVPRLAGVDVRRAVLPAVGRRVCRDVCVGELVVGRVGDWLQFRWRGPRGGEGVRCRGRFSQIWRSNPRGCGWRGRRTGRLEDEIRRRWRRYEMALKSRAFSR